MPMIRSLKVSWPMPKALPLAAALVAVSVLSACGGGGSSSSSAPKKKSGYHNSGFTAKQLSSPLCPRYNAKLAEWEKLVQDRTVALSSATSGSAAIKVVARTAWIDRASDSSDVFYNDLLKVAQPSMKMARLRTEASRNKF